MNFDKPFECRAGCRGPHDVKIKRTGTCRISSARMHMPDVTGSVRLHSLCIPQRGGGGGADDFEGGSQFFWKGARGNVKIFHNRRGGANFLL